MEILRKVIKRDGSDDSKNYPSIQKICVICFVNFSGL